MAFTYGQLKEAAGRVMGSGNQKGSGLDQNVNRALEYFWNFTEWNWRRKQGYLDFLAGQAQIPLPADFGNMISMRGNALRYIRIVEASMEMIETMRIYGIFDGFTSYYSVGQQPQATPATLSADVGSGVAALFQAITPGLVGNGLQVQVTHTTATGGWTSDIIASVLVLTFNNSGGTVSTDNFDMANFVGVDPNSQEVGITMPLENIGNQDDTTMTTPTLAATPLAGATSGSTVQPLRMLEMAPIPASTQIQAAFINYRTCAAQITGDLDVAPVPPGMGAALMQVVRWFSIMDNPDAKPDRVQREQKMMEMLMRQAVNTDMSAAPANRGVMKGPVSRALREGVFLPFTQIEPFSSTSS